LASVANQPIERCRSQTSGGAYHWLFIQYIQNAPALIARQPPMFSLRTSQDEEEEDEGNGNGNGKGKEDDDYTDEGYSERA
jgi:hypothetical protein